jgi:hypothetical protein
MSAKVIGGIAALAIAFTVAAPANAKTNDLFCSQLAYTGSLYYIQLVNPTAPPGMCTAAKQAFTQEEFQDIPGLKRQCVLDSDQQIKEKHAIVSIYSDGTQGSVDAAKLICKNNSK